MTQNCVPLCCQHEVGRAGTTNTAQLLDLIPILYHYHETGNSVVQGTVHDLIYYICICNTIRTDSGQVESNKIGLRTAEKILTQMGGSFRRHEADGKFTAEAILPIVPEDADE